MKVNAPGNIILLGEYAVLEEGGLGVACAVERRVRLEAHPAPDFLVEAVWPGGSSTWTPGGGTVSPVVSAAYQVVNEWRRSQKAGDIPGMRVRIDSSELFLEHGRKAGFGSSAAVAAALVIALCAARRALQTVRTLQARTSRWPHIAWPRGAPAAAMTYFVPFSAAGGCFREDAFQPGRSIGHLRSLLQMPGFTCSVVRPRYLLGVPSNRFSNGRIETRNAPAGSWMSPTRT